jgi:hypothetical protein
MTIVSFSAVGFPLGLDTQATRSVRQVTAHREPWPCLELEIHHLDNTTHCKLDEVANLKCEAYTVKARVGTSVISLRRNRLPS